MNTIIKQKDFTMLKLKAMILPLIIFIINIIQAQENINNTSGLETQADIDWEALNYAQNNMYSAKEHEETIRAGVLDGNRYLDKFMKRNSQLAEAFWCNYPEDKRRNKALTLFFNPYAEPYFVPKVVSDSLVQLLASISLPDKRYGRLFPVDNEDFEHWWQTGNEMVASVLNSNTSLKDKEQADFLLISREFRYIMKLDNRLTKEKTESNYWNRFEIQYWKHIRLLLENHINKYAAMEIVANRVQNILNLLKFYSVSASDAYWKYFFDTTSNNNPLSNQPGIKALYQLAKENVAAIEALKTLDFTKPLEMAFTAIDGSQVDLVKMKGKVVLIDFWATYCGPCIKEMPHVRALYDKYRDLGFEVIGIAADGDENKIRILDILKKMGANWPQRLDKGTEASVSFHSLYKVTSLPTVWLLNKDGVIVDRNARGERLEPLIRKYLDL